MTLVQLHVFNRFFKNTLAALLYYIIIPAFLFLPSASAPPLQSSPMATRAITEYDGKRLLARWIAELSQMSSAQTVVVSALIKWQLQMGMPRLSLKRSMDGS